MVEKLKLRAVHMILVYAGLYAIFEIYAQIRFRVGRRKEE